MIVSFHPLFEADQNIICAGRDPEASDLAGVDVVFSAQENDAPPLLLEINYFFGRKGLGGSEAYYKILQAEIQTWLAGV